MRNLLCPMSIPTGYVFRIVRRIEPTQIQVVFFRFS